MVISLFFIFLFFLKFIAAVGGHSIVPKTTSANAASASP